MDTTMYDRRDARQERSIGFGIERIEMALRARVVAGRCQESNGQGFGDLPGTPAAQGWASCLGVTQGPGGEPRGQVANGGPSGIQ